MMRPVSPIRVLYVCENFSTIGGAEKLVHNLSIVLQDSGFEPHFAIVGSGKLHEYLRSTGCIIYQLASDGIAAKLCDLQLKHSFHLMHSHLLKMNTFTAIAAKRSRVPCISTVHGLLPHEKTVRARLYGWLAGNLSKVTVTVSDSLRRDVRHTYRIPSRKLVTIYNGIMRPDLTSISAPDSGENLEHLTICAVGNVKPVKGYEYLIAAFALISKVLPHARLAIAGDSSLAESLGLTALVASLGLENRVTFLGTVENVNTLLSKSSLYVCSSLHEGFSLTTVEAMAAGLPVVATRCGGPEEIVVEGETGLLVPIADSRALAAGILAVLTDKERAHRMGEAGKKRAYDKFTMEKCAEAHARLYRSLIGAAD